MHIKQVLYTIWHYDLNITLLKCIIPIIISIFYNCSTGPLRSRFSMHGMGMAWSWHAGHGLIGAHRARRDAARRHLYEFRSKGYAPAGGENRTPPTRESRSYVLDKIQFCLERMIPIPELVGSKKFLWILHSSSRTWAAACPAELYIQFSINTYRSTR